MTRNSLTRRPALGSTQRSVRLGLLLLGFGMGCSALESRALKPSVEGEAGRAGSSLTGGAGGNHRGGSSNRGGSGTSDAGDAGASGAPSNEHCGDGHRGGDEECDDGNLVADDGCDSDCGIETSSATCGDGRKEGKEDCDDGNQQPGDGCDERCRKEECGNSRVDAGEECDPPSAGHCTTHCIKSSAKCGDGKVQQSDGEQCDDENDTAGDGCVDCRKECGDGRIDSSLGEECEREYSPDHCTEGCRWAPTCGDGNVQTELGEECDPSNGVTCVACKVRSPPSCEDGTAGCGGDGECVPDGSSGLLENGDFTSDTSGWTAADSSIHLKSVDDGSPSPRALEVAFDESQVRAESGAYQCIAVRGGETYELEAKYRIPAGAPAGVGAAVVGFLYAGTQCKGSFVGASLRGPQGLARDAWTAYSFQIDTSALPADGSQARVLLRLDVVQPSGVDGSRVLWDSVLLNEPGARCGDCHVDAGETCDDGNRTPGDGCDATCERERCGDGVRSNGEECDDGNTKYGTSGDTCTPACRVASACDVCAASSCHDETAGCFGLTGEATAGPGAGIARSTLCDELLACVRRTACDLATRTTQGVTGTFMENCYCGTSGEHCFDDATTPNGSCRAEVRAALETTKPVELLARFDGTAVSYPAFGAVRDLLACEGTSCSEHCARTATCGDRQLQDRNLDFTFIVDRQEVPCADELTASGRGCSFEECDDGNTTPGDGCDQYCFSEACGNHVVQAGEECDDGNTTSHDGCDSDCQGEFECGNGILEPEFEDCEPPSQDGADCTEEQAATDPDSCGCDASCHLAICGDGVKQSPFEQCDPPNGFSCGEDCKFLAQSPCHDCLVANASLGEYQTTACDTDAKCTLVQNCAVAKRCFSPVAAVCWCGITDIDACRATGFPFPPPTTPLNCVPEISAGYDNPTSNVDATDRLFLDIYPASPAFAILNVVENFAPECIEDCL